MKGHQDQDFFETRKFSQAGSENFHIYSQTQLQLKEDEAYSVPESDRNRRAAGSDQELVVIHGQNQQRAQGNYPGQAGSPNNRYKNQGFDKKE